MTISINQTSLKLALDRANPNSLASMLRMVAIGDVLRNLPTYLRGKAPLAVAAYPYIVQSGAQAVALPDDAKGLTLFAAYGRAGTATATALTIDATASSAPAAGHAKLSPSGDIMFNSTDAWTSVDAVYLPNKMDVVELFLPVIPGTGLCTLPTTQNGLPALYVSLMEAEALTGTVVGKEAILAPGAAPGSSRQANLNVALTGVFFEVADAVTSCRVKLGIASLVDVDALLTAASIQQ